jgi:hypothetical protein
MYRISGTLSPGSADPAARSGEVIAGILARLPQPVSTSDYIVGVIGEIYACGPSIVKRFQMGVNCE